MKTELKPGKLNGGGLVVLWLAVASFGLAQTPDESVSEPVSESGAQEEAGAGAPLPVEPESAPVTVPPEENSPDAEASPTPADAPVDPALVAPAAAIPVQYGVYRYEPIWKNSPFMLETPLTTVVEDSFAKDLAVTSVSTIEGRTRVGYVNTKTRATNSATNEKPNDAGILVASVQSNPDPNKVVVELSQGGKTAKVSYDPMTLQGKPAVPRPAAAPRGEGPPGGSSIGRPPGAGPPTGGPSGDDRSEAARRRIVLPRSIVLPGAQEQSAQPAVQPQQQQADVPLPHLQPPQ